MEGEGTLTLDMYHYDHFIGKALVNFDPLVRNKGHEIVDVSVMEDGRTMAKVKVLDIVEKDSYWIFIMVGGWEEELKEGDGGGKEGGVNEPAPWVLDLGQLCD